MNLKDLKMKLSQDLIDHKELNEFLDREMIRLYPDLSASSEDEQIEYKYFGLRNELTLSILCGVIAEFHRFESDE